MGMNKIAAAYKAAEQLSVLSRLDLGHEKTANALEDVINYLPIIETPEDRMKSRLGYGLGGLGLGTMAGRLMGKGLGGDFGAIVGMPIGAALGGVLGIENSKGEDPIYAQKLRDLGLAYEF